LRWINGTAHPCGQGKSVALQQPTDHPHRNQQQFKRVSSCMNPNGLPNDGKVQLFEVALCLAPRACCKVNDEMAGQALHALRALPVPRPGVDAPVDHW
jgi:hypothetical protein